VLPGGTCSPAVVLYGQVTDCVFPLARNAPLDPDLGPHVADVDLPYDEQNDEQATCVVEAAPPTSPTGGMPAEAARLVCRNVIAYYTSGERTVRPRISGEFADVMATFTAVDGGEYPVQLISAGGQEPYVFGYSPLRVWAYGPGSFEAGLARLWVRDDPSVRWTVNVPAAGDGGDPIEIDVGGLAPGEYRLTPCIGPTDDTCDEVPGGITFQIGTGRLVELMPGWNRPSADRINVVFAASGQVTLDAARATARDLLTWDGPMLVGADDAVVGPDASPGDVWSVEFGPFAIEPMRSARGAFNFWFLDDLVADPQALAFTAPPTACCDVPPQFYLPDLQVTRLDFLAPGRYGQSESGWSSFTSPDGPTVVTRDGMQFAGVYLALPSGYTRMQADILAHEWGHSLFDLRDEYVDTTRSVTHGYPNCAPDAATAEAWWGDRVGDVDPFVHEYQDVMASWGQWTDPDLVERTTVGMVPGGCYSDREQDAVRPTEDSIMNSGVPVFGAVNRARAEEILSLFTGVAPLTPEVASIVCEPVDPSRLEADCSVSVESYVDLPAEGLTATVDGATAACPVTSGGGADPAVLTCEPMALAGDGPWVVAVAGPGGVDAGEGSIAAVPPSTTTSTTTFAPAAAPAVPRSTTGAWIFIAALVTIILGCGGVLVARFARR
jgi:hypothetical protein